MATAASDLESRPISGDLELSKFRLEQARYRTDLLKWIVIAMGAVASFAIIDVGKLALEKSRFADERQRQLLEAYLKATESPQPEVWKRKLNVLKTFAETAEIKKWADDELQYIETTSGLDALYLETLKVASQLIEPDRLKDPERIKARVRYNQLYWADLPHAGESSEVIKAMVAFRSALIEAEKNTADTQAWNQLNSHLITLSKVFREEQLKKRSQPAHKSNASTRDKPG